MSYTKYKVDQFLEVTTGQFKGTIVRVGAIYPRHDGTALIELNRKIGDDQDTWYSFVSEMDHVIEAMTKHV